MHIHRRIMIPVGRKSWGTRHRKSHEFFHSWELQFSALSSQPPGSFLSSYIFDFKLFFSLYKLATDTAYICICYMLYAIHARIRIIHSCEASCSTQHAAHISHLLPQLNHHEPEPQQPPESNRGKGFHDCLRSSIFSSAIIYAIIISINSVWLRLKLHCLMAISL